MSEPSQNRHLLERLGKALMAASEAIQATPDDRWYLVVVKEDDLPLVLDFETTEQLASTVYDLREQQRQQPLSPIYVFCFHGRQFILEKGPVWKLRCGETEIPLITTFSAPADPSGSLLEPQLVEVPSSTDEAEEAEDLEEEEESEDEVRQRFVVDE